MRKIHTLIILAAILPAQSLFAHGQGKAIQSKPCAMIASACSKAGFSENGHKKFWFNCMKPVLLGKTVKGVTVDPAVIKACRTNKIGEHQKELLQLQKVQKASS